MHGIVVYAVYAVQLLLRDLEVPGMLLASHICYVHLLFAMYILLGLLFSVKIVKV